MRGEPLSYVIQQLFLLFIHNSPILLPLLSIHNLSIRHPFYYSIIRPLQFNTTFIIHPPLKSMTWEESVHHRLLHQKCFSHLIIKSNFVWRLGFFPLLVSGCGDVLHKSQQRTRGRDLRSCLWQDQIRWLLSKSGNHVVIRFWNLAPFRLENCFRPKIGPEIGPGPCAPPST